MTLSWASCGAGKSISPPIACPRGSRSRISGCTWSRSCCFCGSTLNYLPPELKQPEPITAAAINNYVRTRLLPEPRKKRYYRVHIAYLIMICTLKQALRLSELQTLLPGDLPEDEVRRTYDAYVRRHQLCAQYFIDQVRLTAAAMFDREVTMELAVRDTPEMITSAAILSGFARLFAEKLLLLEGKTLATGGSIEVRT